jgi:hypothetical protein
MSIPALRIEVNGELIAVAGAEDLSLLMGTVGFGADKGENLDASKIMLSVMGLAVNRPQPQRLTWGKSVKLKVGDRVAFELVEVDNPTPPDEILGSPSPAELAREANHQKKTPARRSK